MNRTSSRVTTQNQISSQDHYTLGQNAVRLSSSCPIQWQHIALKERVEAHDHEFTEIVLIRQGTVGHHTNGKSEKIGQGAVLVIPPGPIHAYSLPPAFQECELINIYYLAEWFLWDLNLLWNEGLVPLFFAAQLFRRPHTPQIWQFTLSEKELAACERELSDISAEYQESTPSLLFVRGAFFKILVILARAWHRQTLQSNWHFRPEIWQAIQAVDQCIKDGESFGVAEFARRVGLATGSFSRLFHEATGFSPSEYFGRRRTQHAAHLLLESDYSVGEIASRLGFCDSAHLSRAFQQNQGLSPSLFRTRYRSQNV